MGRQIEKAEQKKSPPLSERMKVVAEMVSIGLSVADIGCDHGYIAIYLVKAGFCPKCIAADLSLGPLYAAKKNIEKYGVSGKVITRQSDGLKNIKKGEIQALVISGMGGKLINNILSEEIEKTVSMTELILEPQSDAEDIRVFLYENGFKIERETLVLERGKYYPVIKAVRGFSPPLKKEEYVYGPCLLGDRNALLKVYLKKEESRVRTLLFDISKQDGEAANLAALRLKEEERIIKKALERYDMLVLASGSPRRRELLSQIGIKTQVIPSNADESLDTTEPQFLVEELSRRKCLDVAARIECGLVLGADTVVAAEGRILGKPEGEEGARKMLRFLSGKTHQVYTGVTLIKKEGGKIVDERVFSERTDVTFADLSEKEIEEYVKTGEALDKAGSYGIQGVFARYVKRIDGDYFNVVGLPLAAVYAELKKMQEKTNEM